MGAAMANGTWLATSTLCPNSGISSASGRGTRFQEFRNDSQGCYWYVVAALEVIPDQLTLTYRMQAKISGATPCRVAFAVTQHKGHVARRPSPPRGQG